MPKTYNSWSKDKCLDIALTCDTKIDFYNNRKAYKAAQKNNWLNEIYSSMGWSIRKSNRENVPVVK